jgi:predicted nuclease of predicted toxin-antitoxin system
LKILFDEDVPRKLARCLPRHEIHTVGARVESTLVGMQWGGIKNGALLTLIEREHFDVFLTGDKNMDNQQRLKGRPFAVLIMSAINWPVIRPHLHKISDALDEAQPGSVMTIDCGAFIAHLKRPSE